MYSLLRKYTFLTRCQAIVNLTERHIDSFSNVWTIKGFCSRNDTHYNFEDRIEVKPTSKLLLETTGMHIHITNLLTLGWHVNVGIDNPVQDPQSLSSPLTTKVSNAGLLIHKEEDGKVIHIVNKKRLSDIASQVPTLRVQVPVSLDLCVNAFDCGNVTLQNLTVRNLSCCTRNGDVTSENLKCENFNVISTNGNVICRGPVLGNVHVSVSGNGHISVDRLQGMDICLQADSGNIKAEALYAEKSFVSSVNANVTLANLHGNSTVNVGRGNLHLGESFEFHFATQSHTCS